MHCRLVYTLPFLAKLAPSFAMPYSSEWVQYNLNTNQEAGTTVTSYSGSWNGHTYQPSPTNGRSLPVYTIILGTHTSSVGDKGDDSELG